MKVPRYPWTLMVKTYGVVLPKVHRYLSEWRDWASRIPDPELRRQALMSIDTKTFHCEGGSIYGLLAGDMKDEAIRFIIAYQTISDYLDNLCDRSTSQDPEDFRVLHESMFHALKPGEKPRNYYRLRREQDDGGYLVALVKTCQEVLAKVPAYEHIVPALFELAGYYCDLQVLKHIRVEERIPRLQTWFEQYKKQLPEMRWYEFCACAGSTLGIFCLVSSDGRSTFGACGKASSFTGFRSCSSDSPLLFLLRSWMRCLTALESTFVSNRKAASSCSRWSSSVVASRKSLFFWYSHLK